MPRKRARALWAWVRADRRRGFFTWLTAIIVAGSVAYGIAIRQDQIRRDATARATQLVREQGQAGLVIIRKRALAECRRGNDLQSDLRTLTLAQNTFGGLLAGFLDAIVARSKDAAKVPTLTKAQRKSLQDAIDTETALSEAVPQGLRVPAVPRPCEEVVPTIAELRAQASTAGDHP